MRLSVIATVVVLVAGGAFLLGRSTDTSSTVVTVGPGIASEGESGGTAYLGASQSLNSSPHGFAYAVPAGVEWIDADGVIHENGHPSCVPVNGAAHVKQMKAVKYTSPDGSTSGTILWIQC